ncbi:MAG: hypothetical protein ACR2PL_11790 [Dehalococcoidia bacterium]
MEQPLLQSASETERLFQALLEQWRTDTQLMSVASRMVKHPAYEAIVAMAWVAVPLLLRKLETQPGHYFVAMSAITGENPIPPDDAGDIRKMAQAWLEWGRECGYLGSESNSGGHWIFPKKIA